MLVFFVSGRHPGMLNHFFDTWGVALRPRVRLVYYEDLERLDHLPGGSTYVFTDLERLTPAGLRVAAELADLLTGDAATPRILNHPCRALGRYDLLRALHERQLIPYQVHRALPIPAAPRFPVFLRNEHAHDVITPLLWTRRDLERAVLRALVNGHDPATLLVVEFQDTRDQAGIFRLFGAYLIGDEFSPGILSFDSHWLVKTGRRPPAGELLAEQRAAATSREHEPALREIAELARIDYGRFDYALCDGQVCLWELNTNPSLLMEEHLYSPETRKDREPIAETLLAAFADLASDTGTGPTVPWTPPPEVKLPLIAEVPRPSFYYNVNQYRAAPI
jgi:hypothetical protein